MDYGESRKNDFRMDEGTSRVNDVLVVNSARKSYRSFNGKKRLVFDKVHLTLPQGTVYGLLGPSGCGKTSLIRCILGRLNLDEGLISVFGHCPGTAASGVPGPNVGYMPQETCIPETLTIGECWTYYGTVLGMPKQKINEAIDYFIQLLNLPPANSLNSQLSGGELRRVAFATALIHEPKLLILDEPTVGIDCITKKNMWAHLLNLAIQKKTSIILTTHYIEEARSAHKVGLMHDNTLVVEDYTEKLIQRLGCNSLESAFLKICSTSNQMANFDRTIDGEAVDAWIPQREIEPVRIQSSAKDADNENELQKVKSRGQRLFSLKDFYVRSFVLKAIILKNLLHLYRFPGVLLFVIILPCIQVTASIFTFKEVVGQVQFALVNHDSGNLGNHYLACLNKDIFKLKSYDSDVSAFEAFHGGQVRGIIIIKQNFSHAHLDRISNYPIVKADVFNESVINITLDYFDAQSTFQRLHLLGAYERFSYSTYNETGLNYLYARPVIYFEREVVEYISTPRNLEQLIAVMSMTAFFAPAAVAIFTLFVDLNYGHLERSIVAGVTSAEIIIGLLIILMGFGLFQIAMILIVPSALSLDALSWSSFLLVFLILYFNGLCGIATGIFLSMVCSQVYILLILAGNVTILSGAICGGFWPLASIPYFVRGFYLALPPAYQVKTIAAIYSSKSFYVTSTFCSMSLSLFYTLGFILSSMVLLRIKT